MKERHFIAFKFSKSNHIICRARINGVSAQLLIDTGASNSCINVQLQEHFKLRVKGYSFDAAGAGRDKMEAIASRKAKLQLGRHAVGKMGFILIDLTHINKILESQGVVSIEGILGADFLKKHKASIDYRNKKIWF